MFGVEVKRRITLQLWMVFNISFIYAAVADAQEESEYLELTENAAALPKGFHPGGFITVNGTIYSDARRFAINLVDASGYNVYLHINPRFDKNVIVFYIKVNGDWNEGSRENLDISCLSRGQPFQISILCNATGYMIGFNKNMSHFYNHRFETSTIRQIKVWGDATFDKVLYNPGNVTCVLEGCHDNAHCFQEGEDYYCKCNEGYSGPRCQDTCKQKGCLGNNVCVIENGIYACRRRDNLDGYSMNSSVQCRAPYLAVETECIWVVQNKLNWDAARIICQDNGGFLFEPDFPVNFMQYMSNNYPESGNTCYWLGGADRGLDHWVWVTSLMAIPDPPHFPWGDGEPNDLGYGIKEDCMNLFTHSGKPYFYNDGKCTAEVFYICEASPLAINMIEAHDQCTHQMQIAILVFLLMLITIVAGNIIYNNLDVVKKVYGTISSRSLSFLNQNSLLHEERENI